MSCRKREEITNQEEIQKQANIEFTYDLLYFHYVHTHKWVRNVYLMIVCPERSYPAERMGRELM